MKAGEATRGAAAEPIPHGPRMLQEGHPFPPCREPQATMITAIVLYSALKWLLAGGGAYGLTRVAVRTADAVCYHTDRTANEMLGEQAVDQVVDVAVLAEPEDAVVEARDDFVGPARPGRRGRLVRALVVIARAEFGAPFGSSFDKPLIREATRLKVGDYLRKVCRDRHVRKTDMALVVDAAVEGYFVPSRWDIRRAKAMNSAIVKDRQAYMQWCMNDAGPGWFSRLLMAFEGVGTGPRFLGPPGEASMRLTGQ